MGVGKLALMPFEYATSQDFLSLSELQIDSYFGIFSLYSMLQKELKNIQGTSIKGMTKSDLLEKKVTIPKNGMATVFLTNFIRCRTSFRMLFRLSLTMSLLGCDDLRQELTVKVRLPR